eukprot:scaffold15004_cov130-Isochrysis_galbana.AAC.2
MHGRVGFGLELVAWRAIGRLGLGAQGGGGALGGRPQHAAAYRAQSERLAACSARARAGPEQAGLHTGHTRHG